MCVCEYVCVSVRVTVCVSPCVSACVSSLWPSLPVVRSPAAATSPVASQGMLCVQRVRVCVYVIRPVCYLTSSA